jgi:DNA-binding MarR family transcriptional regulator
LGVSNQQNSHDPAPEVCLQATAALPDEHAAAWLGFMATHAEIVRALEAGLASGFGLSVSALEVLARVARADGGRTRINDLKQGMLLSISRVSRIVVALEDRGLMKRTSCPSDSRGVLAEITDHGRELARRALEWHSAEIQNRFFAALKDDQIAELGSIWRDIAAHNSPEHTEPPVAMAVAAMTDGAGRHES